MGEGCTLDLVLQPLNASSLNTKAAAGNWRVGDGFHPRLRSNLPHQDSRTILAIFVPLPKPLPSMSSHALPCPVYTHPLLPAL